MCGLRRVGIKSGQSTAGEGGRDDTEEPSLCVEEPSLCVSSPCVCSIAIFSAVLCCAWFFVAFSSDGVAETVPLSSSLVFQVNRPLVLSALYDKICRLS